MSREYPDWISPARAAEGKRTFSGTIPLSRMKRLAGLLVNAEGEATFTASFKTDLDKRVIVDLQVEAALPLICQASLEVYDEQVNRRSELAVIEYENEQEELPDNYEPVLTEHGRLAVAVLVEDELLLALPQIPRKPGLQKVRYSTGGQSFEDSGFEDGESEDGGAPTGVKKNPFAVLQDMLKRDKPD
jgi:uncharacterized protein